MKGEDEELHLRVFLDRSELHTPDGRSISFEEGYSTEGAAERYRAISKALEGGFLGDQIEYCISHAGQLDFRLIDERDTDNMRGLIESVTSEVGRALIGLSVLQLAIKAICPEQSIRLHKGGRGGGFGWQEGVSMRSLDRNFITPVLRQYKLLSMNRDGFMMTRSLAENYPYSRVYKAAVRGARSEWLHLVEALEADRLDPLLGLHFFLSGLLNRAEELAKIGDEVLERLERLELPTGDEMSFTRGLLWSHVTGSDYPARLMELAMHSLMLALEEAGDLGEFDVLPLGQMRSANKKHGNVGDIELADNSELVEAWDAKFGKAYLRDELEELAEKLENQPSVRRAGFVVSTELTHAEEQLRRADEIGQLLSVEVEILSFDEWTDRHLADCSEITSVMPRWLNWYSLALAQRSESAPMDEPTLHWLSEWDSLLESAQA